ARSRLDDREDRPRRHVEPLEHAPEIEPDLAHEPVARVLREELVVRLEDVRVALGLQHPDADLVLVRTEVEDEVVELARERDRPRAPSPCPPASCAAPPRRPGPTRPRACPSRLPRSC